VVKKRRRTSQMMETSFTSAKSVACELQVAQKSVYKVLVFEHKGVHMSIKSLFLDTTSLEGE
jgi:hypothetical protein